MNVSILKQAGIDYDFGVKRFVGRAHLYEKALSKFAKDGTFTRIKAAFEQNDTEGLLASAHEFKGVCGNIGLTGLYEESSAIVQLLRGENFSNEELQKAYRLLEETYHTVHGAVVASMEDAI